LRANVYIDGGCAPQNPGHAGFAVVVRMRGAKMKVLSRYIGVATNNVAEYTALIAGVRYAKEQGATSITVYSDSQLIVNQVNQKWKIKSDDLRPLNFQAREALIRSYPMAWELLWIPREKNVLADHYCTLALNVGRNKNPWRRRRLPSKILDKSSSAYGQRIGMSA